MSEYEIGKDLERLRQRVDALEGQVEDLVKFVLECETCSVVGSLSIEKDHDASRNIRWIRYTFGESECHAMLHKGSWLKVWENGSWESSCTLKDRSEHSKWGNWVFFYVGREKDDVLYVHNTVAAGTARRDPDLVAGQPGAL